MSQGRSAILRDWTGWRDVLGGTSCGSARSAESCPWGGTTLGASTHQGSPDQHQLTRSQQLALAAEASRVLQCIRSGVILPFRSALLRLHLQCMAAVFTPRAGWHTWPDEQPNTSPPQTTCLSFLGRAGQA